MEGVNASIKKGPGLYEFLVEAELQHYFNCFKNTLKIAHPSQIKFTAESDLIEIGMSKPEMRRLRKYYDKHFPNNYLSKLKKIINYKKPGHSPITFIDNHLQTEPISREPKMSSKHIIPAASITINKELGMGEFGVVQQGVWCNEGERIQVAIKCLSRDKMQSNMVEFLKEASIMHHIDHPNIVRFFGVVLPNIEGSLMLVTELAPLRSLLECLKEPSLRSSFPVLTLCDFAYQICDGMQYLEANRLIHRDLAARNILVFSKNKVKISDFGLSRALGQGKDYYQTNFNVNLKLPIAWCAPECISYLRFTTASDVWAFGVTLWEMFSYGFQPWAALTGQQILEAIDEPKFQRLEQPDCCPLDHYNLMMDCWRHESSSRPKFAEIGPILAECRPEQVQTKAASTDGPHMLTYRVGDVITVLDKKTHHPLWKGVTASGKTGLFDPANVVTYLGSDLPSSSFLRTESTRSSLRRKLRSEMISAPQGDFKHTGHVGLDGAYFGDLSFLGGSKGNYGSVPTQVVLPFRPHKDLEAAPLLESDVPAPAPLQDHEYHEISDEDDAHSPQLDLGPSLMAEMELMLNSFVQPPLPPTHHHHQQQQQQQQSQQQQFVDHDSSNRSNELREKFNINNNNNNNNNNHNGGSSGNNSKSKKQATVKPLSANDQKTLDTAIALANEISTKSLSAPAPTTPASPNKKKFSFRFPSVGEHDKTNERRNFSEEALSTPDLQKYTGSPSSIDELSNNSLRLPLWDKASAEFYFAKSRELLSRPFPLTQRVPSYSSCRNLTTLQDDNYVHHHHYHQQHHHQPQQQHHSNYDLDIENQFENLSFVDDYYRPPPTQYRDRTLTKSESMARKTYDSRYHHHHHHQHHQEDFYREPINYLNGSQYFETSYVYYKTDNVFNESNSFDKELKFERQTVSNNTNNKTVAPPPPTTTKDIYERPRTLSFSDTPIHEHLPRRTSRSIRDRNRRRQSYNPKAYESSSSDSDCISVGSVDLDWRRRRRLSRLSASNTSIRSEMGKRTTNPFLKPNFNMKLMGRSPPPSNSILSGLSPTSAARCQRTSSSSSDSSL